MRFARLSLIAALLALTACTSTPDDVSPPITTPPAPPATPSAPPPTSASVTNGLNAYLEQRAHVERVGFRLRRAAASYCAEQGRVRPDLGIVVWSLANFPNPDDRTRLASTFHLTDAVSVALAVDGGPAAKAGLTTNSVITSVNGDEIGAGKGATERFITLSNLAARQGPVRVGLANGKTAVLKPETICEFPTLLVRSPEINAAADGRVFAITTSLFELTRSDDELALILGHELAHNVLGHLKETQTAQKSGGLLDAFIRATIGSAVAQTVSQPFTIEKEKEADYAGLYFMARAGFNISAAETFWERLNKTTRAQNVLKTHPSGEERLAALTKTVAEIRDKQKAKQPLEPDLKRPQ